MLTIDRLGSRHQGSREGLMTHALSRVLLAGWLGLTVSAAAHGADEADPARMFRPPRRPPVPAVRAAAWVRNPVDAFILSGLEARGLTPNRRADRLRLLRRVTVDLTGLPPTLAEQEAFLADPAPDAYERVV